MERLRIPATKSNLIRLKDELELAQEGKELLTQKREVLVMQLMDLQEETEHKREQLNQLLEKSYQAFAMEAMMDGYDDMERLAIAIPPHP